MTPVPGRGYDVLREEGHGLQDVRLACVGIPDEHVEALALQLQRADGLEVLDDDALDHEGKLLGPGSTAIGARPSRKRPRWCACPRSGIQGTSERRSRQMGVLAGVIQAN